MTIIHPTAIVEAGARLGEGVEIGPYCIVGSHVELGDGVRLASHVSISGHTTIGESVVISPFASLGGPPQSIKYRNEPSRLIVGPHTVIREYVTMHVGTQDGGMVTQVGSHGMFMIGSHVAHDCTVGDHAIFANYACIAGHVELGDYVVISALAGVTQFRRVGSHAFISAAAKVDSDIIPYGLVRNGENDSANARLYGLNIIGLKRRNVSGAELLRMRKAYRTLFSAADTLAERIQQLEEAHQGDTEIMTILEFVRSSQKLCTPKTTAKD